MPIVPIVVKVHPDNGKALVQTKVWPRDDKEPGYDNQDAFNKTFNVFIQEMLHLQRPQHAEC